MPIYEYECQDCKQIFEEWQSGFEEKVLDCPVCGASAKRLISNTSFHLKGSGWYVTDYAGKNPSGQKQAGDNGNGNGNGNCSSSDSPPDAKAAKRQATKEAACPNTSAPSGGKASDSAA